MRAGLVAAMLIFASACGASAPLTPTSPVPQVTALTVTGVVLGPTGAPTAGVRTEVIKGPGTGQFILTDAQGRFRLDTVSAGGVMQLRWSRDGYATTDSPVVTAEGATATIDGTLKRGAWRFSGTVVDRNGPVNRADVAVVVYNYPEDFAAWTQTDSQGRFEMLVTRAVGDGELRTSHGSYAKQADKFSCTPPASDPGAALCGSQPAVGLNVLLAKVVGITLVEPSVVYVGDAALIRREVRLDDGRSIVDDGSSSLFVSNDVNRTWAYDPAIAKVMTGPGGLSHVFGLAVGEATLASVIGSVGATMPIRVETRPPTSR